MPKVEIKEGETVVDLEGGFLLTPESEEGRLSFSELDKKYRIQKAVVIPKEKKNGERQ